MGDEVAVLIAVLFVFIGIIAMAIAMVFVVIRRKAFKNLPEELTSASVIRTYSQTDAMNQNFSSQTVDRANANYVTKYYIEFKLKDGMRRTFKVKKKIYKEISELDKGQLKFKGDSFIHFEVTGKAKPVAPDLFFIKGAKSTKKLYFYGEIKELNVVVESNEEVSAGFDDLERLIKDLGNLKEDWFFVVKNQKDTVATIEREAEENIKLSMIVKNKSSEKVISLTELIHELKGVFK